MVLKILKKIKLIISNILFAFRSLFWKKDKSVVLLGAWFGEKFADNTRYLFQYLDAHKEELKLTRVIWVTRKQEVCELLRELKYEAYMIGTPESTAAHKLAGYHIVCNAPTDGPFFKGEIEGKLSYRATRINLWHGVGGIKGAGYSSLEYKHKRAQHPIVCGIKETLITNSALYRRFITYPGGWGDCYYLSTTAEETKIMQQFSLFPKRHFIESCYPRVLKCEKYLPNEERILNEMRRHSNTILYLPTFRGENCRYDFQSVAESMKDFLMEKDILWIEKAHSAAMQDIRTETCKNNILRLTSDFDINVLMPEISVLITDYSSAKADAQFFYKPIIFYVPDYEEYCSGDRGFMLDPQKVLCGPKIKNTDTLKKYLDDNLDQLSTLVDDKYLAVREECWNEEGNSMRKVWESIVRATDNRNVSCER